MMDFMNTKKSRTIGLVVLVLGMLMMSTSYASSNLTRDVGFENGLNGLKIDGEYDPGLTITSSVSRSGGKSVKVQRPSGTNRVELSDSHSGRAPLHKTVWYGWSLRVDKNDNSGRLIVSQIHHHQGSNRDNQWSQTANFIVRHQDGKFSLKHGYQSNHPRHTRKDNYRELGEGKLGKWYDFVVQVKWTWRSDGFIKMWKDGKLVYEHHGSTYFDYGSKTQGPYWKAGAYTETRPALVYVDEYRMGNSSATYKDVAPNRSTAGETLKAPSNLSVIAIPSSQIK
jgi:Polysaccharide lyase